MKHALILAAAMLVAAPPLAVPAFANDSSAAIGLGGLALKRNDAVRLDSELLFLSADRVTVKYRFTNTSAHDVKTLVSFPLPAVPDGISGYLGDQSYPDWQGLDFTTHVDGRAVALERVDVATVKGRNVDALLKARGWDPFLPFDPEAHHVFDRLTAAEKAQLLREGLFKQGDMGVEPAWSVQTHMTRTQLFPAGKTIEVSHSYKPILGGSVAGALGTAEAQTFYRKTYCTDAAFMAGYNKRVQRNPNHYEQSLAYVLKSGANWKGPIRDFRLVVDKGDADTLVSFCMDGVKKISPTRFEVRKRNFEPSRDLDILLVRWADAQD